MKPRVKPIHLKIFLALFIDTILLLLLMLVSYTFFFHSARAGDVNTSSDPTRSSVNCDSAISGTSSIEDCPTSTPEPPPPNTLEPSPTETLEPSVTNTPEPSPTDTLEPSATLILEPSSTSTLEPSATFTPQPSPTNTRIPPSPTNTPKPSRTPTIKPTNTQTKTVVPTKTPSPSITSTITLTPTPSQTPTPSTSTPGVTSVPEVSTCTDCYKVKDFRELIVSGLYSADLVNTEEITSTFAVSITLYDGYKGVIISQTINMVDTQPANKVMMVETPLWCISPTANGVYWIHTQASAQKITGELWFVMDEWVQITLSDGKMK
jgi:hypothetical protein